MVFNYLAMNIPFHRLFEKNFEYDSTGCDLWRWDCVSKVLVDKRILRELQTGDRTVRRMRFWAFDARV